MTSSWKLTVGHVTNLVQYSQKSISTNVCCNKYPYLPFPVLFPISKLQFATFWRLYDRLHFELNQMSEEFDNTFPWIHCQEQGIVRFNTLRPRQNGHHFPDDIFKYIFLNENVFISIKISLKFVPQCPIYNIPALVQIIAWRRPGHKPLPEPMMDIGIDTSIFGHPWLGNLTTPPYPSALPRGVVRLPSHGWRHSDRNRGINFYSVMAPLSLINSCRSGCVHTRNCSENCFESTTMERTVTDRCHSSLFGHGLVTIIFTL